MSDSTDQTGQSPESPRQISMPGGVYIQGDVNTAGGDFIRGDKHVFVSNDPNAVRERRRQMLLLEHVRRFWVEDYLAHSLLAADFLQLVQQDQPEMVQNPWQGVAERPTGAAQPETEAWDLREKFERSGRSLLLLGAPGAGKTISLVKLAEALIDRAAKDPVQPIPVVLNLSTWGERGGDLAAWVVMELNDKYKVNRDLGRRWLENDDLLLLLDGLDEVRTEQQAACVRAINAFRQQHGMTGMAVCCRIEEYQALPLKLDLGEAVLLQPLSAGQVDAYLERDAQHLAALRQALGDDPVLRELANTPLMLSVMSLAYQDLPPEALALPEAGTEERRNHLFETFINRMFERHGKEDLYPRQQALAWLAWLARGMQAHSQSIFVLDDLQPSWLAQPSWPDSALKRWGYTLLTRVLPAGLWGALTGLALGLGALWLAGRVLGMGEARQLSYGLGLIGMLGGLFALLGGLAGLAQALVSAARLGSRARRTAGAIQERPSRRQAVVDFLANGAPPALVTGALLVLGVAVLAQLGQVLSGLAIGAFEWAIWLQWIAISVAAVLVVFGLSWGASGRDARADIYLVEVLQWSWARAGRGALLGMLAGAAAGLTLGLILAAFDPVYALPVFMLCGAPLGLLSAGVLGFAAGLRGQSVEVNVTPISGIQRSARYAVLSGLILAPGGVGLAAIGGLVSLSLLGLIVPETAGFSTLLDFGLVFSLLAGAQIAFIGLMRTGGRAILQHALLYALLAGGGQLPWRPVRFLDYASDLALLRRVGGGYVFTHRLLMEHISRREGGA